MRGRVYIALAPMGYPLLIDTRAGPA